MSDLPPPAPPAPLPPAVPPDVARIAAGVLERMSDAYVVLDREYRFVYANRSAERDMQKSLAELRGRVHWEVFPASHDIEAGRRYRAAAETKVPQHFTEHYRYEGYDIHMEMDAYPTDEGGVAVFWRDVTARVRAEAALRASEAQVRDHLAELEQTYRHAPVGLFTFDREYRFTRINQRMAEINGFSVEAHLGRSMWEIVPEMADALVEIYRPVLAHGEPVLDIELRGETPAAPGVVRDWTASYFPLRSGTGEIVGLIGAVLEVTDRRRAERLLRESEARARIAFRDTPVPMWIFDRDTLRFLDVNDAAVRTYGWSAEEFASMTLRDVRPAEEQARLDALLATDRPVGMENVPVRHRTRDGRVLDVEITTHDTTYGGGRARVVLALDVTERTRAEAALRESEARYATAARATGHAIWDWDLTTDHITWTDGLTTVFGHTRDADRNGAWWETCIHPDDHERVTAGIRAVVERTDGGSEWRDAYRLCRADGSWADVHDRGYLTRDADGRAVRMIGALEDVTAQRQLEERLRQAQKMEAVGQLAGGIAHDFNNLLTVIAGNLEFVRGDLPPDHATRPDLDEIASATERARALVRQLLTFSRRQPVQPRLVHPGEVVRGMERLLHRVIGEEIALEVHVEADAPRVLIDPGQLEQVVMNLVVNARDAMRTRRHGHPGTGGVLSVEVAARTLGTDARRRVDDAPPGRYAQLTVRDSGHGMDAATRARAFEPFFTTKGVGEGTGLGLATVHGIVAQAGGAIRVESAPGRGSTFVIHLPAAPDEKAALPAAGAAPGPAATTATVLVVEDEAPVRAIVRRTLERRGYAVLEARHGADALLLWARHRDAIDVVLTDVRMPEMDGRALVARLRAERPGLPVLYVSGYADEGTSAPPAATDAFVEKPFTADALLAAIGALLGGARG